MTGYSYIIDTIVKQILSNKPDNQGETMIRVDGFENIEIYEAIARKITEQLEKENLTVNIKLAKKKFRHFEETQNCTSCIQSMKEKNWVAEAESITHYRNLHDSNILILFGTETEEDQGGFLNFYTITPDTLVRDLNKKYSKVFGKCLEYFCEEDKEVVDKLYKDLFDYVPCDICKLSEFADKCELFITINDFIETFYKTLPLWGFPYREIARPKVSEIKKVNNVLANEFKFISRQDYKTASDYKKYEKKIDIYKEENNEYSNDEYWNNRDIDNYDKFANILKAYILGEDIENNKKALLKVDFNIIKDVLGLKIKSEKTSKKDSNKPTSVKGEPLQAFTSALLDTMKSLSQDSQIAEITFKVSQAEIVTKYSEYGIAESEEKSPLQDAWELICKYTNGIIEFLNDRMWTMGNDEVVELSLEPKNIFSPKSEDSSYFINESIVKYAGANKSISKVDFTVICKDKNGSIINEEEFSWNFPSNSDWLYSFYEICEQNINNNYIPVANSDNLYSLVLSKSENEFFDIYDETAINFINILEFVKDEFRADNEFQDRILAQFNNLGEKFKDFIQAINEEGFYNCIKKDGDSKLLKLTEVYNGLGDLLIKQTLPSDKLFILNVFIHAFNILENIEIAKGEKDANCCIVPPWHPAALEKISDQKKFFLNGCKEWWDTNKDNPDKKCSVANMIDDLQQMSMIQNSLDIFPCDQIFFGATNSYGYFSIYAKDKFQHRSRLKDLINKDAIYDDAFNLKDNIIMNDDAKMINDVLNDYLKAFPNSYKNLNLVFINPSDLQPIVAAIYEYIEDIKENKLIKNPHINICIRILVKPENNGGRNYLAYWMDESFAQDPNVNIKTYLNTWQEKNILERIINGNNDIAFVMDLLKVKNYYFEKQSNEKNLNISSESLNESNFNECRFPIVYKPSPISKNSILRRTIELSQPQFPSSFMHTQVVRLRRDPSDVPEYSYIATREVHIDDEFNDIISMLHEKAYWIACIDRSIDGALLKNSKNGKNYSIIGFSTGKGAYGQYNVTITTRESILKTIKQKLKTRLYSLFHWDEKICKDVAQLCINEAAGLDGISLFSAINPNDYNINEFMAYLLTSLREKSKEEQPALKIIIHIDSYKHWFKKEKDNDTQSRPDFLVLEVNNNSDEKLKLKATIVECKIAHYSEGHKEKAIFQARHGIERLKSIFDPASKSIKRRYWYAQLYRALTFAQASISDNSDDFIILSKKLRSILDGEYDIEWSGNVLGFWIDKDNNDEILHDTDYPDIKLYDIPQQCIRKLLLTFVDENNQIIESNLQYQEVSSSVFNYEQEEDNVINNQIEFEEELETENNENLIDSSSTNDNSIDIIESSNYDTQTNDVEPITTEIKETKDNEKEAAFDSNIVSIAEEKEDIIEISNDKNVSAENSISKLEEMRVLIGAKNNSAEKVYWEFGHPSLANRHMLITGTSGQGKTYSIQTMLYELSKVNISSIIFDYTEGFRKDQLEKEFLDKMDNKISQHIVKFDGVPINPFKQHEIDICGEKRVEPAADVAARFANILLHVYKFGDQQFAAIFEATRIGIEKYGRDMNMLHFEEELENQIQTNKSAQTVLSKMKPLFGSINFSQKDDFNWDDILYSDDAVTKIFQLTSIDREMQVIITELMLWDAWYYTKKVGSKEKPFVVVLDEAQNLSHKDKSPSATILTEGRKFGWSAWFATQSLKVLDDDEVVRLLQSAMKLYFKPTDDEIPKISKQLNPTDAKIWLQPLKMLKKGQCIIVGEQKKENGLLGYTKPTIVNITSFENRG